MQVAADAFARNLPVTFRVRTSTIEFYTALMRVSKSKGWTDLDYGVDTKFVTSQGTWVRRVTCNTGCITCHREASRREGQISSPVVAQVFIPEPMVSSDRGHRPIAYSSVSDVYFWTFQRSVPQSRWVVRFEVVADGNAAGGDVELTWHGPTTTTIANVAYLTQSALMKLASIFGGVEVVLESHDAV